MKTFFVIIIISLFFSSCCFEPDGTLIVRIVNETKERVVFYLSPPLDSQYGDSIAIEPNSDYYFFETGRYNTKGMDCSDNFFENSVTWKVSNNLVLDKKIYLQDNWEHLYSGKRCLTSDECIFTITEEDYNNAEPIE